MADYSVTHNVSPNGFVKLANAATGHGFSFPKADIDRVIRVLQAAKNVSAGGASITVGPMTAAEVKSACGCASIGDKVTARCNRPGHNPWASIANGQPKAQPGHWGDDAFIAAERADEMGR